MAPWPESSRPSERPATDSPGVHAAPDNLSAEIDPPIPPPGPADSAADEYFPDPEIAGLTASGRAKLAGEAAKLAAEDPAMEALADLPPDMKALVLKAGANARELKVKRRDSAAAKEFFTQNPLWTVGNILDLMEWSGKLPKVKDESLFDRLWHARKGRDLKFLFLYLNKILKERQELNLTNRFPALQPVELEKMYPPRKTKVKRGG